jgi:hypothetical protein
VSLSKHRTHHKRDRQTSDSDDAESVDESESDDSEYSPAVNPPRRRTVRVRKADSKKRPRQRASVTPTRARASTKGKRKGSQAPPRRDRTKANAKGGTKRTGKSKRKSKLVMSQPLLPFDDNILDEIDEAILDALVLAETNEPLAPISTPVLIHEMDTSSAALEERKSSPKVQASHRDGGVIASPRPLPQHDLQPPQEQPQLRKERYPNKTPRVGPVFQAELPALRQRGDVGVAFEETVARFRCERIIYPDQILRLPGLDPSVAELTAFFERLHTGSNEPRRNPIRHASLAIRARHKSPRQLRPLGSGKSKTPVKS